MEYFLYFEALHYINFLSYNISLYSEMCEFCIAKPDLKYTVPTYFCQSNMQLESKGKGKTKYILYKNKV